MSTANLMLYSFGIAHESVTNRGRLGVKDVLEICTRLLRYQRVTIQLNLRGHAS